MGTKPFLFRTLSHNLCFSLSCPLKNMVEFSRHYMAYHDDIIIADNGIHCLCIFSLFHLFSTIIYFPYIFFHLHPPTFPCNCHTVVCDYEFFLFSFMLKPSTFLYFKIIKSVKGGFRTKGVTTCFSREKFNPWEVL